jgi:transmembrane sensor
MDFAHGNRTLRLVNGEALFTVTHHDGVPFTVVSGPTTTRVLGTTFLVRRYATDTMTTIAVQDGKVAMRSVVLTAQQQLTVDRTGAMQVQLADDEQFAFATGVLALRYMPLANAIPELNRWFDADVRLGDAALGTRGIRGKFLAGSRADLAADLEMMFDVRVVRDGRILTLFPRR